MSQVSTEQIKNSLKQCMDPEVPLSIVDMGLIYGIDVTENGIAKPPFEESIRELFAAN